MFAFGIVVAVIVTIFSSFTSAIRADKDGLQHGGSCKGTYIFFYVKTLFRYILNIL